MLKIPLTAVSRRADVYRAEPAEASNVSTHSACTVIIKGNSVHR